MKRIARDILYSTKIWLTSVLVSPFLLVIALMIEEGFGGAGNDALGFIMMAIMVGFVFSIPCWIALMVAVRVVYNAEHEEHKFKSIINIIAIIIALIIFGFVFGGIYQPEGFAWAIPYIITLTFGIWYYELKPKDAQVPTTIDHLIE